MQQVSVLMYISLFLQLSSHMYCTNQKQRSPWIAAIRDSTCEDGMLSMLRDDSSCYCSKMVAWERALRIAVIRKGSSGCLREEVCNWHFELWTISTLPFPSLFPPFSIFYFSIALPKLELWQQASQNIFYLIHHFIKPSHASIHMFLPINMANLSFYNRMSSESASESEDYTERLRKKLKRDEAEVNITPAIDITDLALARFDQIKSHYNFVSFEESDRAKQYLSGKVEAHSLPLHNFAEEMYSFRRLGYCANPDSSSKGLLFAPTYQHLKDKSELMGEVITPTHEDFLTTAYEKSTGRNKKELTKLYKAQREKGDGPFESRGPWSGYGEKMSNGGLTTEQKEQLAKAEATKQIKIEESKQVERNFQPYSIFHWGQYTDYKGLSYVEPPVDYKRGGDNCYLPKKEVHTWLGSQKAGYQVVRFFPKVGHFFLLGTPEGKVHLFDTVKDRSCAHSYIGHSKAVRDVQFSHDGKQFLSASFDSRVLHWDTEYGKANASFALKRIPLTLKFHPSQYHPNVFFCGTNQKKIFQFDLRTGEKTMEYTQHLGAVNTLTFIEENKFVSSSDDKKLFIWEYGVPVVTRHVSEPEMHTITATAMHPSNEFYAGQSSDNQIVIYENKGGNFRRIRAKKFDSHYCAGYACAIDFSYDGQFLASGDERGKIYFYDWKTSKAYRVLDGHAGACIGLEWHPSQPTTVISCGWEGMVKLWQ